ncbi:bacteriorhodopsin [Hymenobacter lapidiphilus]|uniref:Bacteriorhodopsin n=1 Tax=Hymenobacter lapidiphilus TaxID=2608003 RepID=A0A7Y7PP92_9BACT|nr:bacteriorhodopsin [Hymenobacter lapidiphilus]NVO31491.1 bacteriorhodopsin [Hymenobacter lapidiphilus]
METQTLLYWLYVALMVGGALLFWIWSRDPKNVPQYEYSLAMLIPIWSALAYTGMALGQGSVEVAGQTTYYARYLDWVVSTPLLLLALGFTAMFYTPKHERSITLLFGLVAADVVMILCGLLADLSESSTARLTWFLCGVGAFVAVLYLLWVPLRKLAANSDVELGSIYNKLLSFLTVLWIAYPTIWALGPSGLFLFGQTIETLLFVVVPFLSKVGFSILDLSYLRDLASRRPPKHHKAPVAV